MMIGMLPDDGNHSPSTTIAEKAVVTIMTLNRPTRSAMMPGRIRPNILVLLVAFIYKVGRLSYEAALRIGIRYIDKFTDIP